MIYSNVIFVTLAGPRIFLCFTSFATSSTIRSYKILIAQLLYASLRRQTIELKQHIFCVLI
jgi:hypothetical protein